MEWLGGAYVYVYSGASGRGHSLQFSNSGEQLPLTLTRFSELSVDLHAQNVYRIGNNIMSRSSKEVVLIALLIP
jgi:hypothetical protein